MNKVKHRLAGSFIDSYDTAVAALREAMTRTRPMGEYFDGSADNEIAEAKRAVMAARQDLVTAITETPAS